MELGSAFDRYLKESSFLDFNHPEIVRFIETNTNKNDNALEKLIHLYYIIRDTIRYDTYHINFAPHYFKASVIARSTNAFCVQKSLLYCAIARKLGIPSRLGYADVKNHIATEKIKEQMQSDVFVFHGYTDLFIQNKWVKATPVFNKSLCEKLNVSALDFDGTKDALFQEYDRAGKKSMEYIHFYGTYADLPYEKMIKRFQEAYPHLYNLI